MFLTNHSSAFLLHDVRVVKNVACLSPFSTRRICSRDAKRKQEFSNVIGWRKSSLLRQPITLPDSCFRFASREQIRLVENGLNSSLAAVWFKFKNFTVDDF